MLFHETQIEKYKIIFNCETRVEADSSRESRLRRMNQNIFAIQ